MISILNQNEDGTFTVKLSNETEPVILTDKQFDELLKETLMENYEEFVEEIIEELSFEQEE